LRILLVLPILYEIFDFIKSLSIEPILIPKLQIDFADFPYLHYLLNHSLLNLETSCGCEYGTCKSFLIWLVKPFAPINFIVTFVNLFSKSIIIWFIFKSVISSSPRDQISRNYTNKSLFIKKRYLFNCF